MSTQHRLPDYAVRPGPRTLYCPDCTREMKIVKAATVEPGRETCIYVCDCGHSERVTFTIDTA